MLHIMETTSKGWKHVGILVDDKASTLVPPYDPTPVLPPPTPRRKPRQLRHATRVMGWLVGDCHTFSKDGKTTFNRQLYKAGFRWTARRHASYPQRYRNGAIQRFEIRHYATTSVATRVS